MQFSNIKSEYLQVLNNLRNYILFPQDRLEAIRKLGFSDFSDTVERYNKQILQARLLYEELQTLTEFGWISNSSYTWSYSIIKCGLQMGLCRISAIKMFQIKTDVEELNQPVLFPYSIFRISKENNEYILNNQDGQKLKITYDMICMALPRVPDIDPENSKLELDLSDRFHVEINQDFVIV